MYQKAIVDLWLSDTPFETLNKIVSQDDSSYPPMPVVAHNETMTRIWDRLGTTPDALAQLTHCVLPQFKDVVEKYQGMGLRDQELVQAGLLYTQDAIISWHRPDTITMPNDNLREHVRRELTRYLNNHFSDLYDTPITYLSVVWLYHEIQPYLDDDDLQTVCDEMIAEYHRIGECELGNPGPFKERRIDSSDPFYGNIVARVHSITHQELSDQPDEQIDGSAHNNRPVEEEIMQLALQDELRVILDTLSPREADIISKLFGLGERNRIYSLAEIGEIYGIGDDRVRQIASKAVRSIRHPTRSHRLEPFYPNPRIGRNKKPE